MNKEMQKTLDAAEETVNKLVEACRKDSHLYVQNPRFVAQVSRNGKWLLNAIGVLKRELSKPRTDEDRQND